MLNATPGCPGLARLAEPRMPDQGTVDQLNTLCRQSPITTSSDATVNGSSPAVNIFLFFLFRPVKRSSGPPHYQVVVRYGAKASAPYQHLAGLFGGTVQPGIASHLPVFSESACK